MSIFGCCRECGRYVEVTPFRNDEQGVAERLEDQMNPEHYVVKEHFNRDGDKEYCKGTRKHPEHIDFL